MDATVCRADMSAYFRFVLRHRLAMVVVCLVLTAGSGALLSRAVVASSVGKLFFGDAPRYAAYLNRARAFVNSEMLVLAYEEPAPLSMPSLRRLRAAVGSLEALPEVNRVESLLNAQRIWSEGEDLRVESYAKMAERYPGSAAKLLRELLRDDKYRGLLIGKDGRHGALMIELTVDAQRSAERTPAFMREVQARMKAAGFRAEQLHRAGIPALMAEIMQQTLLNIGRSLPITILVLLVVVVWLFRRAGPAVLSMTISFLAMAWTMGFAQLLDREINILMSVVPAVILIVAFSDTIHLWNAYLVERAAGKEQREAILASAVEVGAACLLTSATTFIGFLCLSAVPTPMFRQLGLVLGFGVAVALLLAMTLTPIALSLMKDRRLPSPPPNERPIPDRLDGLLAMAARTSIKHPWALISGFTLLLLASLAGLSQLTIDTDLARRMGEDHSFRLDRQYFRHHFAGTQMLEVFVTAERDNGMLDQETFRRAAAFQHKLAEHPEVDKVFSLITVIEELHRALGGPGRLPQEPGGIAQYLLLFEVSGGKQLEQFVDFTRRTIRLAVRLKDHSVRKTYALGQQAERIGGKILGQHARVEASGMVYLIGWWLDAILDGQKTGLLLSLVIISLMMVLGLRSLRVGLLSMVPNVLPLLALGGLLGATTDQVDSDALIIAMMAIGIGVDDTIHFLMRYRIESSRTADAALALRRTYQLSGRAIVLTSVVLVLGFSPFALSEYYSTQILGTLLPMVLIVALLADLLLVPALVRVGLLHFAPRHTVVHAPAPVIAESQPQSPLPSDELVELAEIQPATGDQDVSRREW